MAEYFFTGGSEYVKIKVDSERKLYIANSFTKLKYMLLTESFFNDKEKKNQFNLMMSKIPKLTQDELDVYLIFEFKKMGYILRSKIQDELDTRHNQ